MENVEAPASPVIDFDFRSQAYAKNWIADAHNRLEHFPVAWTNAHGGHWVFSRYADVRAAADDFKTFSSDNRNPEKPMLKGIIIPASPHRLSLSESDPPIHGPIRMTEAPFFAPRAISKLEKVVVKRVNMIIDAVIESGRTDFVTDIATPIPAMTTMELAGVDLAHWREFALSAHELSFRSPDDPLYPHKEVAFVQSKLLELLHQRRANPTGDVLSALATRVIDGVPMSDETTMGMLNAFIFGGFDTATAALANALLWLENKQDIYLRLLTDDALINNAVEEFLRAFPSNHGLGRTATRDVVVAGQRIRAGDRVYLSWASANRDPRKFSNPDAVVLDRPNANEHMAFSSGIHKCLGAPLARMEIRHVLRAVLKRMPDFRIDHANVVPYPSFGSVAGYDKLPMSFTPGPRLTPRLEAAA